MANPKLIKQIMDDGFHACDGEVPHWPLCRGAGPAANRCRVHPDESEVLTPADEEHHVDKHAFTTPFVCGARNLGEALRRIAEGAAMIYAPRAKLALGM